MLFTSMNGRWAGSGMRFLAAVRTDGELVDGEAGAEPCGPLPAPCTGKASLEGKRDVLGRGVVDIVGRGRETGGEGEGGSPSEAKGKCRAVGRGHGESAAGHRERVGGM